MSTSRSTFSGDGNAPSGVGLTFDAKITAVNLSGGNYYYQFVEVTFSPTTGQFVNLVGPRFGTYNPTGPTGFNPAFEMNNELVAVGTYVQMRLRGVTWGQMCYEFMAPPKEGSETEVPATVHSQPAVTEYLVASPGANTTTAPVYVVQIQNNGGNTSPPTAQLTTQYFTNGTTGASGNQYQLVGDTGGHAVTFTQLTTLTSAGIQVNQQVSSPTTNQVQLSIYPPNGVPATPANVFYQLMVQDGSNNMSQFAQLVALNSAPGPVGIYYQLVTGNPEITIGNNTGAQGYQLVYTMTGNNVTQFTQQLAIYNGSSVQTATTTNTVSGTQLTTTTPSNLTLALGASIVTAATQAANDNSTKVATTAYADRAGAGGNGSWIRNYAGTFTFTATFTGNHRIQLWGAGGPTPSNPGGTASGGSGGGEYRESTVSLVGGTNYTVVVGAGSHISVGGASTTFATTTVVANQGVSSSAGANGTGGTGGTGTIGFNGGDGSNPALSTAGAGGGSGGTGSAGNNGSGTTGGAAVTGGGAGGNASVAGGSPGGGAGGTTISGPQVNGADGQARITW